MTRSAIFVVAVLLSGCVVSDERPAATESPSPFIPIAPQIEQGVYDHSAMVAKKLPPDVEVVSATYDVRPTYADGAPIHEYQLRFNKPGRYGVTFVAPWPTRDWPADRRTIEVQVSEHETRLADTAQTPIHPDQPSHLTWVGVGQVVHFRWAGACFPIYHGWELDRIAGPAQVVGP